MIMYPEKCLRGKTTCQPYGQIASTCGTSFFCCGENDGSERSIEQDKYTLCFKGEFLDTTSNNDKRDLIHLVATISQALAIIEENDSEAEDKQDE